MPTKYSSVDDTLPNAPDHHAFYYDWVNHGVISEREIRAILADLIARGMVRRAAYGLYQLIVDWP